MTNHEPVTGRERACDPSEPLAALAQFYRALNNRNMGLMEQNWDASGEAAMDNPLGGITRGWTEIRSVYELLFDRANQYQFEFHDYSLQRYGEVFIAIGRERGQFLSEDCVSFDLTIRTTRIFRWAEDRWRQIHYHGSIDDPDMLARYQQAVLKIVA